MTQRVKSGDQQIRAFEASLTKVLGAENFPREAIGDLSLLLDTLRRGVKLLTDIMELKKSFERNPAVKLQELEILLDDDVRMILKDLLPPLRKATKEAYSTRSNTDGENRAKRLLKKVERLQSKAK